jgi:putative phosphoribosyl transferase
MLVSRSEVQIGIGANHLQGLLSIPSEPRGLVIFAHGSGSSRFSVRNQEVARKLNDYGVATLLFDLLTRDEESVDRKDGRYRFNTALLSHRLMTATRWAHRNPLCDHLAISYFGASTGAAAAVMAAAEMPESISTVVSRGGRVDLAGVAALHELRAPMLMIVGEFDTEVFNLNQMASHELRVRNQVELIEGATHLFEEGDSLQRVADKAASWFLEGFSSNNLPERRKVHVTHNR